jgi:hypothetical protein
LDDIDHPEAEKNMYRTHLLSMCFLMGAFSFAAIVRANDAVSPAAQKAQDQTRMLAPLVSAGYDVNTAAGVHAALKSGKPWVQVAALRVVASRRLRALLPTTRQLLKSPSSDVRLAACESLSSLEPQSKAWRPVTAKLLQDDSQLNRIHAAAILASCGDGAGWGEVKSALFSKNSALALEAALAAVPFQNIAAENGMRINVLSVCLNAFSQSDEAGQTNIFGAIDALAEYQDVANLRNAMRSAKSDYLRESFQSLINRLQQRHISIVPKDMPQG